MSNMRDQMRNIVKHQDKHGDRYWINDMGPKLHGALVYEGSDDHTIEIDSFVGMVDEQAGGMIAYGDATTMRGIADKLNEWEIFKELMT